MIELRPFSSLGRMDIDWLAARYHFSFANYYEPRRLNFGPLRVWNDDAIQPGGGFPMHGHRDMEIITYIREGAITHEDHLGNRGRTEAGQVQVMSAGTGILHSEFNHESSITRLFQIWIEPNRAGLRPGWGTREFPVGDRAGKLVALASGQRGQEDALRINQDATLFAATIAAGGSAPHYLDAGRRAYLVPATGRISINGIEAHARDGVAIDGETELTIDALEDSEIVLVDLP